MNASVENSELTEADWEKGQGLLPAVIQDQATGTVLMLGYFTQDSLQLSIETGEVHFYSRSRQRLWKKGESSGNTLRIRSIGLDCDKDTFLVTVNPAGPTCHTGSVSCFSTETKSELQFLGHLQTTIDERWMGASPGPSYVASLRNSGLRRITQKVGEESVETIIAALSGNSREDFTGECADLLFHFLVLLRAKETTLSEVVDVLRSRHSSSPRVRETE